MEEKLAGTIDEKFKEFIPPNQQINKIDQVVETYADKARKTKDAVPVMSENEDIRNIVRAIRQEERTEAKEREARADNLIMYGVPEMVPTDGGSDDGEFLSSFFDVIRVEVSAKSFTRLGKPTENKCRPIKIVMKNNADKRLIMSNLNKLKDAPEQFKKLTLTDDHTIEERALIKKLVEEAKLKNQEQGVDGQFIYKVRGSPSKNDLRLVKFTRKKNQVTSK